MSPMGWTISRKLPHHFPTWMAYEDTCCEKMESPQYSHGPGGCCSVDSVKNFLLTERLFMGYPTFFLV